MIFSWRTGTPCHQQLNVMHQHHHCHYYHGGIDQEINQRTILLCCHQLWSMDVLYCQEHQWKQDLTKTCCHTQHDDERQQEAYMNHGIQFVKGEKVGPIEKERLV
jgi:hypothetical protein